MLFERIVSIGLAHYSYLIGDRNEAIVIDPRRDCQVYIKKAFSKGMRITHILETHRNEDYFTGSTVLARHTGAEVWHADEQWDYNYGKAARPGQRWRAGRLEVEALSTPGHTPGSLSYLLRDPDGLPWMVFTGDALFAGDVGRTDLLGQERAEEMAGLLYDSIFQTHLPLGDGVLVCPAHGAGSTCGESIAERLWTSIGLEREHNPRLRAAGREEFVNVLLKTHLERPPYFGMMEKVNLRGMPILETIPEPRPLSAPDFAALADGATVLDSRMELGYAAAHVPNSLSIWSGGLASFAGWFLSYDKPILLVGEGNYTEEVVRILLRLGFDDIIGFLAGGMLSWHMAGLQSESQPTVNVLDFCRLLDQDLQPWILDVRSEAELKRNGTVPGGQHIHITQIAERREEVPKDRRVYIFCGSGLRSMIAASYLKRHGWQDLAVVLGGLAGWRSVKCPIKRPAK